MQAKIAALIKSSTTIFGDHFQHLARNNVVDLSEDNDKHHIQLISTYPEISL